MPLPLIARKSLRDNEEHLTAAVESIKESLGVEWSFEFDFEVIHAKATDDYVKNDLGGLFYKTVALEGVAANVKDTAKDEITKEALIEANTNNKVIVRINEDKKDNSYWKFQFENGSLVLLFRMSPCNVSEIRYFKLAKIIPSPGVYSLEARLDLKNNKESWDEALETIKAATGDEWSVDEEALEKVYPGLEASYQTRIGEIFGDCLQNIAANIKKRCEDDMVKEAFTEVTTNHKIVFRKVDKLPEYWVYAFEQVGIREERERERKRDRYT
ncbi:hypothetical protein DFA_11224 [Cavenderia fasciculata]|uniref:Uncharacterized protein n=1 Tax=Cavenderia fasciculata TaxID=261658 RepID=F4QFL0_CACFS|nr:uncharacterized protein DFA_11224 [Cavenderia fasciculata]EGG13463.1 hypothetical protein DFA_11224 [Cavenderia fasciculata]|eukprot:XP_004350167.1 hypothetical protein DFA_11224 [Cavenderia fasciculata]